MNYLTFETERFVLRPTLEEDAPFILELLNTPKWIQNIGDRNVHTVEEAANYIRNRMLPQLERLGFSNYTLIRKSDQVKVGISGLYQREGLDGVDIGYAILPPYEGQGYAFEATQRLMQAAEHEFRFPSVKAITIEENIASRKLLEKLGMQFVKIMKLPNDPVDLWLYEKKFEQGDH